MSTLAFHSLRARRVQAMLAVRRALGLPRTAGIVRTALGEPPARARAIAASSMLANRMHYVTAAWLARQPEATRRRYLEKVSFPDEADVRRVLEHATRGLLVVSIHSDGYLPGILRLCSALRPGLRVNLVKREPPGPQDAVFEALHPPREVRILRTRERPGLAALAALRSGEVVCVMLDVPPTFDAGPTYGAAILGNVLRLPRGPAELAARAGTLILPVVATGRAIECAALIDAAGARDAGRAQRIERIQTELARLVDRWIRARPETWMLWSHLPAFLSGSENVPTGQQKHQQGPPGAAIESQPTAAAAVPTRYTREAASPIR